MTNEVFTVQFILIGKPFGTVVFFTVVGIGNNLAFHLIKCSDVIERKRSSVLCRKFLQLIQVLRRNHIAEHVVTGIIIVRCDFVYHLLSNVEYCAAIILRKGYFMFSIRIVVVSWQTVLEVIAQARSCTFRSCQNTEKWTIKIILHIKSRRVYALHSNFIRIRNCFLSVKVDCSLAANTCLPDRFIAGSCYWRRNSPIIWGRSVNMYLGIRIPQFSVCRADPFFADLCAIRNRNRSFFTSSGKTGSIVIFTERNNNLILCALMIRYSGIGNRIFILFWIVTECYINISIKWILVKCILNICIWKCIHNYTFIHSHSRDFYCDCPIRILTVIRQGTRLSESECVFFCRTNSPGPISFPAFIRFNVVFDFLLRRNCVNFNLCFVGDSIFNWPITFRHIICPGSFSTCSDSYLTPWNYSSIDLQRRIGIVIHRNTGISNSVSNRIQTDFFLTVQNSSPFDCPKTILIHITCSPSSFRGTGIWNVIYSVRLLWTIRILITCCFNCIAGRLKCTGTFKGLIIHIGSVFNHNTFVFANRSDITRKTFLTLFLCKIGNRSSFRGNRCNCVKFQRRANNRIIQVNVSAAAIFWRDGYLIMNLAIIAEIRACFINLNFRIIFVNNIYRFTAAKINLRKRRIKRSAHIEVHWNIRGILNFAGDCVKGWPGIFNAICTILLMNNFPCQITWCVFNFDCCVSW